jgi:hypothetical protein
MCNEWRLVDKSRCGTSCVAAKSCRAEIPTALIPVMTELSLVLRSGVDKVQHDNILCGWEERWHGER